MKNKKIGIIIATILIMLVTIISILILAGTVSIGGGSSRWKAIWEGGLSYFKGTSTGTNYGFLVTEVTAAQHNNIYCIERGAALEAGIKYISGTNPKVDACRYHVRAIVELKGGEARVTYYDEGDWDYNDPSWGNMSSLNSGEHNYILAAILYGEGDSDRGMWTGNGAGQHYTNQQKALYYYWDTWIDKSGFKSSYKHSDSKSEYYDAYKKYKEQADSTDYNVRMWILKPYYDSTYQNLLVADRYDKDDRNIDITVTKKWDDNENTYSNRPESIEVDLYRGGDYLKSMTLSGDMKENEWSETFSDLDPNYTYTVKEDISLPEYDTGEPEGNQSSGFAITNELRTITMKVQKTWYDLDNCYQLRPPSIKLNLMRQKVDESEPAEFVKEISLTENSEWKGTISNLPLYIEHAEMKYWLEEIEPTNYKQTINYNEETDTYEVENTLDKVDINVTKIWEDENDYFNNRPELVRIYLYINSVKQEDKYIDLNEENNWQGTFTDLEPVSGYTVAEETPDGYTMSIKGSVKDGYTITNTLERTSVTVEKKWEDENNELKLRPASIKVSLWQNVNGEETEFANSKGEHVYKTLRGTNTKIPQKDTFNDLPKYIDEVEVYYFVKEEEEQNPKLFEDYMIKEEPIPYDESTNSFIITNVLGYDGYKEIKGRVWIDGEYGKANEIDGKYNATQDTVLEGIKVVLKDEYGNQFDPTSTAITDANGEYTIKVNYDNSEDLYKLYEDVDVVEDKLEKAYVEFEYDGLLYTTISSTGTQSIVNENTDERKDFDEAYCKVTGDSQQLKLEKNEKNIATKITPFNKNRLITARTKAIGTQEFKNVTEKTVMEIEKLTLYCNGNGTYTRTNTRGAWLDFVQGKCSNCQRREHTRKSKIDVEIIQNVNCALFVREQPKVGLFTDITNVKLIMNGQEYTYKYGVRANTIDNASGVLAKFQNKETYTYRRPVNPADIAYIRDNPTGPDGKDRMEVYVTYEIRVANLASTLNLEIDNIRYYFDSNYELANSTHNWSINGGTATNTNELNIKLKAGEETGQDKTTKPIELTFKANYNMLRDLFNNKPPLNFAAEIESYISTYGKDTLYAQQGKGGRTGDAYGGYDYESHPGNAGIFINNGRLQATKMEDDTDIAPAFVLEPKVEALKTLGGTVWEDGQTKTVTVDHTVDDKERLGNGHIDANENVARDVKVELYDLETGEKAKRYDGNGNLINSDVYTNGNGYYKLEGVVTGEYYVKYTYGNYHNGSLEPTKDEDKTEDVKLENPTTIMEGNGTTEIVQVNGRNYKSTIVTDPKIKAIMGMNYGDDGYDKTWHINHTDGYTVAVDNMKDRLKITNLRNQNYDYGINMTAFTKPFKTLVEFETSGNSNVTNEVKTEAEGNVVTGDINVSNQLDRLDFGIIERPQEDLILHKTISYFKITLANGQVLTEGDPTDPSTDIKYAKQIGFRKFNESNLETVESLRNALSKRLLIEVDSELIQGATLDVTYEVIVANNNEIDYDYGNVENYGDIVEKSKAGSGNGDKYITKSEWASYYYYGNIGSLLNEIETELVYVDYASEELVPDTEFNQNTWVNVNATQLQEEGYISNNTLNAIQQNKYRVLRTKGSDEAGPIITLGRGESTDPVVMKVSRVLANKYENVLDNNVEIIEVDAKTARTIKAVIKNEDGAYERLDYKPGNYQPGISGLRDESDEDGVDLLITPPTGITNNIIKYMIITLIGLTIIFVGVIFIKKKILTK